MSTERSPLLKSERNEVNGFAEQDGLLRESDDELRHEPDETDVVIEGMALVLLGELEDRGYAVPPGLVERPPDMSNEEYESELAFFRTVFDVPRHKRVLHNQVPHLAGSNRSRSTTIGESSVLNARSGRPPPRLEMVDTGIISAPSALLLCGLLSLLIALQAELRGTAQETDPGVDGELRAFKARRELVERLYAIVEALLDSYLLSGDQMEDGNDALVTLLFRDFPQDYDSMDRATCAVDLLLNLSSFPLARAGSLISHPVVLATNEYVWRNGLIPPPQEGEDTSLGWTQSVLQLDRFSIPRILHAQSYILSSLHCAITVYILMFSAYAHFDALNPLSPDADVIGIPGHVRIKKYNFWSELVWWLWVAGSIGWFGEVGRTWYRRGPQSSLPLSPSTLLPLIHHTMVFLSLLFRFSLLLMRRKPLFVISTSLSALAWSIPFLGASVVLPQSLPAFGAPTHRRWEKIRDGRKRRDVGYRPPPKAIPESHRALRSIESQLGGLVQFGSYFLVFGLLLLWSLSGQLDYPSLYKSIVEAPLPLVYKARDALASTAAGDGRKVLLSPIEARTTLAATLVLGVILAYFAGGRPSITHGKLADASGRLGLHDLDGWERYGGEVAFRARRERLAVNRYYTYVPPRRNFHPSSVPPAFGTPPLPSPLNLLVPLVVLSSKSARYMGGSSTAARAIQERARLWIWRFGISPIGIWALAAKGIRQLRGKE